MLGAGLAPPESLSTDEAPVCLAQLALNQVFVAFGLDMAALRTERSLVVAERSLRHLFHDLGHFFTFLTLIAAHSIFRCLLQRDELLLQLELAKAGPTASKWTLEVMW